MSGTLLEHVFFVSCPRLDATDGNPITRGGTRYILGWGGAARPLIP